MKAQGAPAPAAPAAGDEGHTEESPAAAAPAVQAGGDSPNE